MSGGTETPRRSGSFLDKYPEHLARGPIAKAPRITKRAAPAAFRRNWGTAGGLDGWDSGELRDLPETAAGWLAAFYRAIESGPPWPAALLKARVAYLAKSEGVTRDPMDFRGLVIASIIYRTWAKMRLHHLGSWISEWIPREAYAGMKGRSAADAWHAAAIDVERALMGQTTTCLGIV